MVMKVRFVWWAAKKNNITHTYIINSRKQHLAIIRRFPFSLFIKQCWLAYGRDHKFYNTTHPKAAKGKCKKEAPLLAFMLQRSDQRYRVRFCPRGHIREMIKQSGGQESSWSVGMMDRTYWDACFGGGEERVSEPDNNIIGSACFNCTSPAIMDPILQIISLSIQKIKIMYIY